MIKSSDPEEIRTPNPKRAADFKSALYTKFQHRANILLITLENHRKFQFHIRKFSEIQLTLLEY